jgi:DNA-directed RNA polymerase subunit N (RpoN/RPB10)
MIPQCKCKTCGSSIGDVAAVYYMERAKKSRAALEKNKTLTTQTIIDAALAVDMSETLKNLGVHTSCCITVITTHMDIEDYY